MEISTYIYRVQEGDLLHLFDRKKWKVGKTISRRYSS